MVTCSGYPSAAVLDGDVLVQDALDMAQLGPYACIRGFLTMVSTGLTNLNGLAGLEVVTGQFMISENPPADRRQRPAVTSPGGARVHLQQQPSGHHPELSRAGPSHRFVL